jgi:hypothetical protein
MTLDQLVQKLQSGDISTEEFKTLAEPLLPKEVPVHKPLTFEIGAKGGLVVKGLNGKFPTTLYVNQWERVFLQIDEMKKFIELNRDKFSIR